MLTVLDQKFQAALDDEAKLREQLIGLTNQRRWNAIGAAVLAAYVFAHVLFVLITYQSTISAQIPLGLNSPPGMVLLPLLVSILLLQLVIKAVVAHCEIRTLLMFKKLRELQTIHLG